MKGGVGGGGQSGGVQPLDVLARPLIVSVRVRPVRVHIGRAPLGVGGVFHLAVQPQTVPPLGAVGAQLARERPLPRVHAHVLHQLVGCPREVAAQVATVLVALAMTLEVNLQLLLPWKRPLADAAAML